MFERVGMARKVFISYRRDDSAGHAGRVHDRLTKEFGRDLLFMDVDSVPLGSNFVDVLEKAVGDCDALIAVIGPNWLEARDEHGRRRLEDPSDFVRVEIAAALRRDIPVIPILLEGTGIPRPAQLPEDLKELSERNALAVRHTSFHADIDKLIRFLRARPQAAGAVQATQSQRILGAHWSWWVGSAVALIVAMMIYSTDWSPRPAEISDAELNKLILRPPERSRSPSEVDAELRAAYKKLCGVHLVVGGGEGVCIQPGSGKWFKDCETCPEMVVVPAGTFVMGSPKEEVGRYSDEEQVPVQIAKPFAVGRYPVTRGEFDTFAKSTGHRRDLICRPYPDAGSTDRDPATCISWTDAKKYVAWLAATTTKTYRLLSEAEREYVARAGTPTPYWWGNDFRSQQRDMANPWGLVGVHGTVLEWTEDCWNSSNVGNPGDGSARRAENCLKHVLRGGEIGYRAAFRYAHYLGDKAEPSHGFRVARTLE